jgi:predicted nucleic acid-binding protein
LVLGGKLAPDDARHAIGRLPKLGIDRVSLDGMLGRMWQLRDAVGAYDAPYVALAEARGLTLATGDVRLARAAAPYCRVEVAN